MNWGSQVMARRVLKSGPRAGLYGKPIVFRGFFPFFLPPDVLIVEEQKNTVFTVSGFNLILSK